MVILSPNTVICAYSVNVSALMLQGFQSLYIALLVLAFYYLKHILYHVIPRRNWTRYVTDVTFPFFLQFLS